MKAKSANTENTAENRDRVIIRTSVIGILTNVLLAVFKAVIGMISNSIAVLLDSVNNLSDALSSIITIVGTKLAGKLPNKKHPLGYGRIEYLSAMIVSGIVLYAGITSAVESIKKILQPEQPDYSVISLIIIAVAVIVKILLGTYVRSKGRKVHSASLEASGSDALFDAVLSASVLASAVIFLLSGVSLEAYVGVIISVFIIKSGIGMMIDTLNDILGTRADKETSLRIKQLLCEEPEVRGAYDLVLYNFGPEKNLASVHLELPDTMTVQQVDELTRRAEERVFAETGVVLAGVGVYSYNTGNDEAARIRSEITERITAHPWALQLHGFYLNTEARSIRFDVVISFDKNVKEGLQTLYDELQKAYPQYAFHITPDVDISD